MEVYPSVGPISLLLFTVYRLSQSQNIFNSYQKETPDFIKKNFELNIHDEELRFKLVSHGTMLGGKLISLLTYISKPFFNSSYIFLIS